MKIYTRSQNNKTQFLTITRVNVDRFSRSFLFEIPKEVFICIHIEFPSDFRCAQRGLNLKTKIATDFNDILRLKRKNSSRQTCGRLLA